MLEVNEDSNVAPEIKPVGEDSGKPRLQLKSHEGPQLDGQKKCPHCERMIPEDDRICLQCGFDLKSGRTQQERERKSGSPVKVVLALAVLAGLAYAGYRFNDDIKKFLGIEGKAGTEISDTSAEDIVEADVEDVEEVAETATGKLEFKIEGDPEELKEELEMQIEDFKSELEGMTEDLNDAKSQVKEYKAEYETAKKAELKAKKLYDKYKRSSKSKSKITDLKDRYKEAIATKKEYEAEYKKVLKDYNQMKSQTSKMKKDLTSAEAKLKQIVEYIEKQ